MKLSIVIVSYNVRYYLEQCLESVFRSIGGIEAEVFVVDNHSRDHTVDYLKHRFGNRISLIESSHNLGFARANNIAIRQSQGDYVLLLNPDTFVTENCLHDVLQFMDSHPRAGGCGVMMHNEDGSRANESRRGMPTPFVSLLKMLGRPRRYYMSYLPWDEPCQIEVISGAFCMLRREALDHIGLLDETFFMYGEDIDLSYRTLKGGYENWYYPAKILHYKGESTQKSSFRYVHVFYQAMIIFFRKHYGHLSFFITLPIKVAIYLRAAIALIEMGYRRMRQLLGFYDRRRAIAHYIFVGGERMLNQCRKLTRRKGLSARFVPVEQVGQCDFDDVTAEGPIYLVYDVDTFGFNGILDFSAQHNTKRLLIGTYSCKTKILITASEIVK